MTEVGLHFFQCYKFHHPLLERAASILCSSRLAVRASRSEVEVDAACDCACVTIGTGTWYKSEDTRGT
jgi:hypothetical protein